MPSWTEIYSGTGNYDMWMENDIGKQRNKHKDPQIKKAGAKIDQIQGAKIASIYRST